MQSRLSTLEPAKGQTVLVVEDDAAIRGNVRDCLKHLGYRVLEAAHGAAALAICDETNGEVDVVMADLVMPGMSGQQIAAEIAKRHPQIRLMYTSGYTEDVAARRELLENDKVFLEKPYTVSELGRAVQRALAGTPRPTARHDKTEETGIELQSAARA
jgi:CheY-like chemotaxis protein